MASQEPSLTVGPTQLTGCWPGDGSGARWPCLAQAFVASVAYVDPGNFATNIQGEGQYGYLLLWVVLAANLMAMVVPYLSAKLGIVTGRALPELVRDRLPRPATWGMWVQGEVVAMATDVAEFIGAALGLNLLFGVPMLPAGLITGLITFAVLGLRAPLAGAASSRRSSRCSGWSPPASCTRPSGSARPSPVRCMAWCPAWMAPARCTWRSGSSAPP